MGVFSAILLLQTTQKTFSPMGITVADLCSERFGSRYDLYCTDDDEKS